MNKPSILALCTLLAAALLAAGCSDSAKDTHPEQLVSKRKALFKQFTKALEPLGLMARERERYDAAKAKAGVAELQRLATLPWAYFRADGNYPPTRAKPEVWQQPAEFKQAQDGYLAALAELGRAVDGPTGLGAVRPAVEKVQQACKDCHDRFRRDAPGD